MPLSCGCNFQAGVPISQEMLKEHYKHTLEALLFWELIIDKGKPQGKANIELSEARIALIDAIDTLYPSASEG
jgi:hypothetical protein